jgi:outer membrane lipoprotein LolB
MHTLHRLTFVSCLLLAACAPKPIEQQQTLGNMPQGAGPSTNAPAKNEVLPEAERKAKTATVSSWELSGGLAIKNLAKHKGYSATLHWVQHGANNYNMRLMGPLGGGTIELSKHGGMVTYKDGAKVYTGSHADTLLGQHTGIHLPVSSLYYWVRGLPAPGPVQSTKLDKYNHLAQLRQNGYIISYPSYSSVGGTDLPNVIHLVGRGVAAKVVIKHWKV